MISSGQVFGRLTAISLIAGLAPNFKSSWSCVCVCGKTTTVFSTNLKRGLTKSCGCLRSELTVERATTHGLSKTPIYNCWASMLERCENKNYHRYQDYGGRGISVCARWHSFDAFHCDMGDIPFNRAQIDRIDNNGNYCKSNCHWTTNQQNASNRRSTRLIEFNGETLCLKAWAARLGITHSALQGRIKRGWSIQKALTQLK